MGFNSGFKGLNEWNGMGAVNDFLQLSDMFDFEGTETPGKRILNFRHFPCDFFLI